MNQQEFVTQIDRLKNVYGDRNYSDERVKAIFGMVKAESGYWWARAVETLLLTHRQPPLMPEIGEMLAVERERRYEREKREHAQDAKDFFSGTYQPDDVKQICQTIIKRMNRGVSDQDWEKFVGLLEETARMTTPPAMRGRGA